MVCLAALLEDVLVLARRGLISAVLGRGHGQDPAVVLYQLLSGQGLSLALEKKGDFSSFLQRNVVGRMVPFAGLFIVKGFSV